MWLYLWTLKSDKCFVGKLIIKTQNKLVCRRDKCNVILKQFEITAFGFHNKGNAVPGCHSA